MQNSFSLIAAFQTKLFYSCFKCILQFSSFWSQCPFLHLHSFHAYGLALAPPRPWSFLCVYCLLLGDHSGCLLSIHKEECSLVLIGSASVG